MKSKKLSIVVPCFNEQEVIQMYVDETRKCLKDIPCSYEFVFIDDGSSDKTLDVLKQIRSAIGNVEIISFSRNFGKEAAILAGLRNATGDLVVVMDSDLQHHPREIPRMIDHIMEGYDTVTTRRVSREKESLVRSFLSKTFYRLINKMTDVEIINGAQDYRMMTRKVVNAILELNEYHRFAKGIFSWVGFKVKYIDVEEFERPAGTSKWGYKSLINYAFEGILSFSTIPLRIATFVGAGMALVAIIMIIQVLIEVFFFGVKQPGYPSTMIALLFIGGLQISLIGIVSEYIAKIYFEVKSRPHYIVSEKYCCEEVGEKRHA